MSTLEAMLNIFSVALCLFLFCSHREAKHVCFIIASLCSFILKYAACKRMTCKIRVIHRKL